MKSNRINRWISQVIIFNPGKTIRVEPGNATDGKADVNRLYQPLSSFLIDHPRSCDHFKPPLGSRCHQTASAALVQGSTKFLTVDFLDQAQAWTIARHERVINFG